MSVAVSTLDPLPPPTGPPVVAASAAPQPTPPQAAPGRLVVTERAVKNMVTGVLTPEVNVHNEDVTVKALSEEGVELEVEMDLDYPSQPVTDVLTTLRRHIAAEVERQLGRPVRSIDLTVAHFVTTPPRRARRVE